MAVRIDATDDDQLVTITFTLNADQPSGPVLVVGSFNDWTPGEHELRPDGDGSTRSAAVTLGRGSIVHFRYLGQDDQWFDDPDAHSVDTNGSVIHANPSEPEQPAPDAAPQNPATQDAAIPSTAPAPLAKAGRSRRPKP